MFLGEFQHTLDSKGRVILPARWRERFAGGLVLAYGKDRCIDVFPLDAFQGEYRHVMDYPSESARARMHQRMLTSQSSEGHPDGQGRITVPPHLREYAGLDREVVIAGAGPIANIWDREAWDRYRVAAAEAFATLDAPFDFTHLPSAT